MKCVTVCLASMPIITSYLLPNSCKEYSNATNKCSWHICQRFSEPWCSASLICGYRQRNVFSFPFLFFGLPSFLVFNIITLLFSYWPCEVDAAFADGPACWRCCLHIWSDAAPQAATSLSNHFNSHATINISPNLSQLATFTVCLKRWLTGLGSVRTVNKIVVQSVSLDALRMDHTDHVRNYLSVLLMVTLPWAVVFGFPQKGVSVFLSHNFLMARCAWMYG